MASCKPCDIPEQELIVKTSNKITSAMTSNQPFYLSFKQVQKLFNSQSACAYSGELFSTTGDITFERINPQVGYVKGNVVLVRKHINTLKGETIDRFIHQSGMSTDALADLFALLARSLKKEFTDSQKKLVEKPLQISKLEERIQAEVVAAKTENGADKSEPTEGARRLMGIFAAAKAHREEKLNEDSNN